LRLTAGQRLRSPLRQHYDPELRRVDCTEIRPHIAPQSGWACPRDSCPESAHVPLPPVVSAIVRSHSQWAACLSGMSDLAPVLAACRNGQCAHVELVPATSSMAAMGVQRSFSVNSSSPQELRARTCSNPTLFWRTCPRQSAIMLCLSATLFRKPPIVFLPRAHATVA